MCNGVSKQMGIEMGETRIGVCYSSLSSESRHDVVDRPQRHRTMAISEKDRSGFPTADENEKIAEILVIDDGNDPCFAAFALAEVIRLRFASKSRTSRLMSSLRRTPSHQSVLIRHRSRKLLALRSNFRTSDGLR